MKHAHIAVTLHRNVFDDTTWGYSPYSYHVEIPFVRSRKQWLARFKTEEDALLYVKGKLTPSFINDYTSVSVSVYNGDVSRVGLIKEWSGEIFDQGINKEQVNKYFEI